MKHIKYWTESGWNKLDDLLSWFVYCTAWTIDRLVIAFRAGFDDGKQLERQRRDYN